MAPIEMHAPCLAFESFKHKILNDCKTLLMYLQKRCLNVTYKMDPSLRPELSTCCMKGVMSEGLNNKITTVNSTTDIYSCNYLIGIISKM